MVNLNDENLIKSIDKSNMLGSIEALPEQCQQTWEEVRDLNIPSDYFSVKNIVVSGMGGSALGTHVFYSLFSEKLKIPLQIINEYHLPASVNRDSLVLLSSYSGNTEETLSCAQEAKKIGAKILGITTGGLLGEFLKEEGFPAYIFLPKHNPCNQPRIGLGYSILGQIALFVKCKLVNLLEEDVFQMISFLKNERERIKEIAKMTASAIKDKIIIVVGSGFLAGNAHIFSNQLNENSKNFSCYFLIPELNHHLLEGLINPSKAKPFIGFFLNSELLEERIKKRINLTKEVFAKNGAEILEFKSEGRNKLEQSFMTLLFGSFLSFYLSILYNQDPSLIPWVNYFKEQLSKS